ncbi:MAG: hypothetical protein CXT77_03995 [uncultured DHVE6 group euryarchaeote]|jgi:hypothetical protein|nr:MAG: hypothetical protein CXT77_03995 [uncultured DHVE6 group euryarchaeote]
MKKGQAQNYFMVIVIIAVLSLVAGIVLFTSLGGKLQENQDVNDAFCKSKIQTLSVKMGPLQTSTITPKWITLLKSFRASCTPQKAIIDPQNWDACDSSFRTLSKTEPTTAATNCAMEQVADKIERCWDMSGEGRRTAFPWACFIVVISDASETPEVSSHTEFKKQILKTFNCPWTDLDCIALAEKSYTPASILAGYNNLIDITETGIMNRIESCRKTEVEEDIEEPTEEQQSELINERTEDIYLKLQPNNVREVLSEYVTDIVTYTDGDGVDDNEEDQEDEVVLDCTLDTIETEIEAGLEDIQSYIAAAEEHELTVLTNYNDAHGNLGLDELPFQLQRDTRLETNTIKFTEAELKKFMKDVPIEGRSTSFCNSISYRGKDCDNRVEYFPKGFTVKQNKLFSVEYCGDTLPVGSNLVASAVCEQGPDQRRILISDTPTGGGSRLINENLNYNCPMLETAADLQKKILGEDTYNAFSSIATICKEGAARILLEE